MRKPLPERSTEGGSTLRDSWESLWELPPSRLASGRGTWPNRRHDGTLGRMALFTAEATEIFGLAKPQLNNFGHPQAVLRASVGFTER
jgi:hypothetical protein